MKAKLYLVSALIASAGTAFAASQKPQYNEMTLPGGVSTAYFRGSLVYADVNGDGNMDLIVKGRDLNNGWNPDVVLITTDNSGNLDNSVKLPASMPYESTLSAFDFNNDGHVDYLLCNYGYELYRNNGDGTFAKVADSGLFAQRNGTMAVGDFNNDGCPDLAVSGWSDAVGNDCITINKNNGDGTFTRVTSDAFAGTEKGQIMFVDVDGDGRLDLFVTGQSGTESWASVAYIYKNNGDETFSKVDASLTGAHKSGCDWADVNGDGMIDIIYSGETSNESKAVVAINEGGLAFTQYDDLLCKARGGVAVAAYDINKNGFPNIAIMGYNNDGAPHMHVYNGLCSRNVNEAPTAPANLAMKADGGKVTLTWDAAADSKTPAEALRYNVYVKLTDGSLVTVIPADPATGTLRLGDVNAALTSRSYTLNISADKIAEWGVQAIDGGKMAGPFAKYDPTSGIDTVTDGAAGISIMCSGSAITVSADATLTVADMAGNVLLGTKVAAGQAVQTGLKAGAYIVRAEGKDGAAVVRKFIIR